MKFKKEILRNQEGLTDDEGEALSFTHEDFAQIVESFRAGKVWIPYGHSTHPRDNTGFVEDLYYDAETEALWAVMEILDEEAIARIEEKLVWDVSVSLKRDEERGWFLVHVALTMDPAVKKQEPFAAVPPDGGGVPGEEDGATSFESGEIVVNLSDQRPFAPLASAAEEDPPAPDSPEEPETSVLGKIRRRLAGGGESRRRRAELAAELAARDRRVAELTAELARERDARLWREAERRASEWERTFNSYVGRKVVPAEREILRRRVPAPEALKIELEARADIAGGMRARTVELAPGASDDWQADLSEEEVAFVKRQGWDRDGHEQYLKNFLALREQQRDNL